MPAQIPRLSRGRRDGFTHGSVPRRSRFGSTLTPFRSGVRLAGARPVGREYLNLRHAQRSLTFPVHMNARARVNESKAAARDG